MKKQTTLFVMVTLLIMLALTGCSQDPNAVITDIVEEIPKEPAIPEETEGTTFPFASHKSVEFTSEKGALISGELVYSFTLLSDDDVTWYFLHSSGEKITFTETDGSWYLESYQVTKDGENMLIGTAVYTPVTSGAS